MNRQTILVALILLIAIFCNFASADNNKESIPGVPLTSNKGDSHNQDSVKGRKNPFSVIKSWFNRKKDNQAHSKGDNRKQEVNLPELAGPVIKESNFEDSKTMPGSPPPQSPLENSDSPSLQDLLGINHINDSSEESEDEKSTQDSDKEVQDPKPSKVQETHTLTKGSTVVLIEKTPTLTKTESSTATVTEIAKETVPSSNDASGKEANYDVPDKEKDTKKPMNLLDPNPAGYSLWIKIVMFVLVVFAIIEFTLYTVNFLYCLLKALFDTPAKAMKCLALLMIVLWLFLRSFYVPFLYEMIPLEGLPRFPEQVYKFSFYSITIIFPILLISPLAAGIYSSIKYGFGNLRMDGSFIGEESSWREVVIVMPVYNEEQHALWRAVQSVLFSQYPANKIKLYISFDDANPSALYHSLMRHLDCHPVDEDKSFPQHIQLVRENVQITISRFPHSGKRGTQAKTYRLLENLYCHLPPIFKPFVLFIDSDIILHQNAVNNFVCSMEKHYEKQAMTGYITCLTSRKRTTPSFLTWIQDCEYMSAQLFSRNLESILGGVTCLPGALTMIRFSALESIAPVYFGNLEMSNTLDYHRFHLGEDRYLTHLLMERFPSHSLGFCPTATCKTEAPNTISKYLKQRRRWLLGSFANEVFFLISPKLLFKIPLVLFYKLLDFSTRSVSFYMYLFFLLAIVGYQFEPWQWVLIFGPLVVVWLLMLVYAVLLKRLKLVIMYPWLLICHPMICLWVNVYALYTWNVRTWGGPRTKVSLLTQITRSLSRSLSRRRKSHSSSKKPHVPLMTEIEPSPPVKRNSTSTRRVSFVEGKPPPLL